MTVVIYLIKDIWWHVCAMRTERQLNRRKRHLQT